MATHWLPTFPTPTGNSKHVVSSTSHDGRADASSREDRPSSPGAEIAAPGSDGSSCRRLTKKRSAHRFATTPLSISPTCKQQPVRPRGGARGEWQKMQLRAVWYPLFRLVEERVQRCRHRSGGSGHNYKRSGDVGKGRRLRSTKDGPVEPGTDARRLFRQLGAARPPSQNDHPPSPGRGHGSGGDQPVSGLVAGRLQLAAGRERQVAAVRDEKKLSAPSVPASGSTTSDRQHGPVLRHRNARWLHRNAEGTCQLASGDGNRS